MRGRRVVSFMLFAVIVIQFVLLIYESRSLQEMSQKRQKKSRRTLGGYTVDTTNRYLIQRFFKSEGFGLHSMEPMDVTLVTHCTVNRLFSIIDLVQVWDGPMSISIFAPGNDAAFAEDAIDGLRLCWPKLRSSTTFHLVYPNETTKRANMTGVGSFAYFSCKDITRKIILRKLSDNSLQFGTKDVNDALHYPHNILRNLAMDGALTDFMLMMDIDLIPSKNLRRDFVQYAKENELFNRRSTVTQATKTRPEKKAVYILPAFELQDDAEDNALTKNDVFKLVRGKKARPLMQEICSQCHDATNYDKWFAREEDKKFGVSHKAIFSPGWEPYYIVRRDTPRYDHNILRYGYDRLSQICMLHAKKYAFLVLNNGFLMKRSFTSRHNMNRRAVLRRDDRVKFHELFRARLQQSGKVPADAIQAC